MKWPKADEHTENELYSDEMSQLLFENMTGFPSYFDVSLSKSDEKYN